MYPHFYFQHFRQLLDGEEVFVAMPFSRAFASSWDKIFCKAIGDVGLKPFRVDVRSVSDSIMIDILRGISRARLVLADISAVSGPWPNGNVLYELGIAHAQRVPETVIVVRSGNRQLPFDLRHIRVFPFDRTKPKPARHKIATLLNDALHEAALLREELVQRAWAAMDPVCRYILSTRWFVEQSEHEAGFVLGAFSAPDGTHGTYGPWSHAEARGGFLRLNELGAIEATEQKLVVGPRTAAPPLVYRWTSLGEAVARKFVAIDS
jgi:hypothetical protein